MGKQIWKPGNMLYPLPAVMVSTGDAQGSTNILTVAWTGTICTNPAMVYISVRPERYSYAMLRESGEFVINLTTEKLGRDEDKWEKTGLHKEKAKELRYAPLIAESPVNIECRVTEVRELGSHHMFMAEVKAVHADEGCLNKTGRLELNRAGLIAYSHGEYLAAGRTLGTFGFSVKKKKTAAKKKAPGQKRRVRQKKSDTTKAT